MAAGRPARLRPVIAVGPDGGIGAPYRTRLPIHPWKGAMKAVPTLANRFALVGIPLGGGPMAIAGETTPGALDAFATGFQAPRALIGFCRKPRQAGVQHRMTADWMQARR